MKTRVHRVQSFDAPVHTAVAIVGAGACGLTAALTLTHMGIECIVLERDAMPAGSTALSSGFVPAASTNAQRSQGIEDSAALLAQDIQSKAKGDASATLVRPMLKRLALQWMRYRCITVYLGKCLILFYIQATAFTACMQCQKKLELV